MSYRLFEFGRMKDRTSNSHHKITAFLIKVCYHICTVKHQNGNHLWKSYCVVSFDMSWHDISKWYPSLPLTVVVYGDGQSRICKGAMRSYRKWYRAHACPEVMWLFPSIFSPYFFPYFFPVFFFPVFFSRIFLPYFFLPYYFFPVLFSLIFFPYLFPVYFLSYIFFP